MKNLRHVFFKSQSSANLRRWDGMVGVRYRYSEMYPYVEVKQLWGEAPRAENLLEILAKSLELSRLEKEHQKGEFPWKVEVRKHTSGAKDFVLRYLRDVHWADTPTASSIHISCYGKLNSGLYVFGPDLPPLLAAVVQEYPQEPLQEIVCYSPEAPGDYNPPGAPSGLWCAVCGKLGCSPEEHPSKNSIIRTLVKTPAGERISIVDTLTATAKKIAEKLDSISTNEIETFLLEEAERPECNFRPLGQLEICVHDWFDKTEA